MAVEGGSPVGAARGDAEIVDKEADDGLQRNAAGRQMQLVERQRVAGAVSVQVGPGRIIA